jgi:small-conductance mechanosensitive channel
MESLIRFFQNNGLVKQTIITAAIFFMIFITRFVFLQFIRKSKTLGIESKRRLSVNSSSFFSFIFVFACIFIWSNEIQTMALSFVAIGVAVVIATKEMILCFMGGIYKATNNLFHIGDRIEINGTRGNVIGKSMLSTKLLEIGPGQRTHQYTGRSITIPNALFLLHNLVNESFTHDYVLHTFSVPLPYDGDWEKAEELLLIKSNEACSDFIEPASKHMHKLEERENIEAPQVEPIVHINFVDHEHMELIVRITVPASEKGKVEQKIKHAFLTDFKGWGTPIR